MKKRISLTLLTLLLGCIACASTTSELIKNEFQGFLPDTLRSVSPLLHYEVSHQELLRNSLEDSLLSRYTLREQQLHFYYPGTNYYIDARFNRQLYNIADFFNLPDQLSMDPRPVFYQLSLAAGFAVSGWQIEPSLQYGFFSYSDTANILQYPRSETDAYNAYFFNLLPGTFGDSISYANSLQLGAASLIIRKNTKAGPVFFSYSYTPAGFLLREAHTNKGDHEKLKGPRESTLSLHSARQTMAFACQFAEHSTLGMEYQYRNMPLDWQHTVFPDEPDTLEIVKLLNGKINAHFLNAAYRYQNEQFTLETHIGGGMLNAGASASTPVLGYFFYILPISHQADADAATRFIHMQAYVNYRFSFGIFNLIPRLDLCAARFFTDANLDALLEFGLEDVHFQQDYIHALYLVSPGLRTDIALNSDLHMYVNAEQLIPFFKTLYPEPPPPVPDDIRRYGGLSINAGVSLKW